MYMRSLKLILFLLYGFNFMRTLDFVGAGTLPDLKSDSLNAKFNPSLVSTHHFDSAKTKHVKLEIKAHSNVAPRLKSAYLPNESMDSTDKLRQKPKRSEFVDDHLEKLETTNLESEEEDDQEPANQTQNAAEELINQKEIIISQQILLVLCFGFIILIFAISRIIMNLGKSIDNRKYLVLHQQ